MQLIALLNLSVLGFSMTKLKEHSREICYEQWQSRRGEVVDPLLFVSTPNHHNHGSCYRPAARSLNHPQYHLRTHNVYLTLFVNSSQLQYCAHIISISQYLVSRRLNLSLTHNLTHFSLTISPRPHENSTNTTVDHSLHLLNHLSIIGPAVCS